MILGIIIGVAVSFFGDFLSKQAFKPVYEVKIKKESNIGNNNERSVNEKEIESLIKENKKANSKNRKANTKNK